MPIAWKSKMVTGGTPGERVTLETLAKTSYDTDVHWAPYDMAEPMDGPTPTPRRVTLATLTETPIVLGFFVADVDTANHATADSEWLADVAQRLSMRVTDERALPWLYRTRGGARIVWTIDLVWVDSVDTADAWKRAYTDRLLALHKSTGIVGDPACSDSVRLYRAPNVVRDGARVWGDTVLGVPHRPGPWPYAPLSESERTVELARLASRGERWRQLLTASLALPPLPPLPSTMRNVEGAVRKAREMVTSAPKGTRNSQLHAAASFLGRLVAKGEMSEHQAREALADAAQSVGLERGESMRTISGALRRR